MIFSDKIYDALKWVQLLLPILGTLYFALAGIWAWPFSDQIVGTLTALTAFLSALLKISNVNYAKAQADTETK